MDSEHYEPLYDKNGWMVKFELPEAVESQFARSQMEVKTPQEVNVEKRLMKEVKKKFKKK